MSSSMPSSHPYNSPERKALLTDFSQKLNALPGDSATVLKVLEGILTNNSFASLQIPLDQNLSIRASEILALISRPSIQTSSRVNTLAIATLRGELIERVHKKVIDLKSRIIKEQLCEEILTEPPPYRIPSFIDRVNRFYDEHLDEMMPPQKALDKALGKALLRSMIDLPTSEEMTNNEDLQEKIDADTELHDYICPIARTPVGSDAVYLDHNPRLRYHEQTIRTWINQRIESHLPCTAPMDRHIINHENVKPDPRAAEFVENKLLPWIYPTLIHKLEPKSLKSQEVEMLHSKTFLLALSAAHSSIKEQYATVLNELSDPQKIEELEIFAEEKARRFTLLTEGMDRELEEIASFYPSIIKEFLKEVEATMTDENLEAARSQLLEKLRVFILLYREISSSQISPISQKRELKRAGAAIKKGSSLKDALMIFNKHLSSIKEEEKIKAAFPKCLIGETEWSELLGDVDDVPLPDGILDILNRPYPLTPEKKIGETHSLMLIPTTVNDEPLSFNSLRNLVRSKGHFLNSEADAADIAMQSVISEHGNTEIDTAHWVLIANDLIPNSNLTSYPEKQAMLDDLSTRSELHYEIPTLLSTAACLFLTHLASKDTYMLKALLTECQEFTAGCPVVIGGFDSNGFLFGIDESYLTNRPYTQGNDSHYVGVLPMLRLGS